MKKYSILLISSLFLYVIIIVFFSYQFQHYDDQSVHAYRSEIHRLLYAITQDKMKSQVDISSCTYVKDVQYLLYENMDKQSMEEFFKEHNDMEMTIHPVYEKEQLLGYARFQYEAVNAMMKHGWMQFIIGCTLIELFSIGMLYWFYKQYMRPLAQLSQLPQSFSQGHYQQVVKQQKNSPLNPFLLSVSQWKDNLEIAEKRRFELEKQKKQMILSISHDVKTPLNLIQLYGKAIADRLYENEDDIQQAAHQIVDKTKVIEGFVDDIVKSSREDILDIQVHLHEFYLDELMKRIENIYVEQCSLRNIKLQIGSYENRLIKGDIDRLQEVMENLFTNAFKYGDGRRIEISFYEEEFHQLIRFFTTGNPIHPQEFNHLFDSFFRGANSQGKSGSGLGLYICKEIMRRMEGDIFAKIDEDGMAFILVLE